MKGIKSTGDLSITGGTFTINSADDSVHSNTSLTVSGGVFEIASGDDAFHADETLTVTAGVINIAESYEGLEALHVDIQGGEITLVATDDGLNAAGGTDSSGTAGGRDGMFGGGRMGGGMSSASTGSIVISGGTLYINASGDGIDANGSLRDLRRIYYDCRAQSGRHRNVGLRYQRGYHRRYFYRKRCFWHGPDL